MINQFIVNGIIAGSVYTLVAVGFAVIYRRSGFFILLMGWCSTPGRILPISSRPGLGCPVIIAAPVAIGLYAMLWIMIEVSVYRPLRHKGASTLIGIF